MYMSGAEKSEPDSDAEPDDVLAPDTVAMVMVEVKLPAALAVCLPGWLGCCGWGCPHRKWA